MDFFIKKPEKRRIINNVPITQTIIISLIIILIICTITFILVSNLNILINDTKDMKRLYSDFSNRISDNVTPQNMFDAYIKNDDDLLQNNYNNNNNNDAHTKIHPDLLLESNQGNPLALQSQGHIYKSSFNERARYETLRHDHLGQEFRNSSTTINDQSKKKASVATVKKYVSALINTPTDEIITPIFKNKREEELHNLLFLEDNDNVKSLSLYKIPRFVHHGGHCTTPVPLEGNNNCSDFCMNSESRLIEGPFISGDKIYPAGKSYCWSGPPSALVENQVHLSGKHRHNDRLLCSDTTAILILKDDGTWSCRPQYPFLFGGRSGMMRKACMYDPYIHEPPSPQLGDDPSEIFQLANHLVDSVTGQTVKSHSDLTKTAYFSKMINASSSTEFLAMANDKEFYRNNFIGCDCSSSALDIFGNKPLTITQSKNLLFFGLCSCNTNPCVMTKVADNFVAYDENDNTCHAIAQKNQAYHALHNDVRTPVVGTLTPAAGIVPASSLALFNNENTANEKPVKLSISFKDASPENPTENLAIKITQLTSPVIPASNNDSSNKTRNVLYVPIQSITITGSKPSNTIRIPSVYFTEGSCTPPISIGSFKTSSPLPFNVAPYFIEPILNVLANSIPEKPYEHELLVLEGLRNSRLISGNVLGGSEMLFSLLLADNGRGKTINVNSSKNKGFLRLERIRKFYNQVFKNRRLSTFEKYKKNIHQNVDITKDDTRFSSWDLIFRRNEVEKFSGIENLDDTFVIREGLLLRCYRAYAGWVLMKDSKNIDFSNLYYEPSSNNNNKFNHAQFMFPTTHSLLPAIDSNDDIFSVDRDVLFDHNTFTRFLTREKSERIEIFNEHSPEYSVSPYAQNSEHGWGLNTFRYLYNFKDNIYTDSDKRLKFDESNWTFEKNILPASIFKKSLIEWGHTHGDIEDGKWLQNSNIDTTLEYRGLLKKTSAVSRPMWWTAVWPRTFWRYSSDFFNINDV
nr:MAG: wsv035-like protein [Metapenaeopsis lamellata majanivirus]